MTGGNFAGFTRYDQDIFIDPGFPIAEIAHDGTAVITKHPGTGGIVDVNTVRCQLLYELQGNTYLHSDSKALLDDVQVEQVGPDRVCLSGVKGHPPPPTTKAAIFYKGGYEAQLLFNVNGYAFSEKCDLFEKQFKTFLGEEALKQLDICELQRIGVPAPNARTQNSGTMYLRIFATARTTKPLLALLGILSKMSLKHFPGFHSSLDFRTAFPRPLLTYYPAIWKQDALVEQAHLLGLDGEAETTFSAGHPPRYEELGPCDNYDTASPVSFNGPLKTVRLGDVALGRSGDKGANANIGLFVDTPKQWEWLRSYLTRSKMQKLTGDDWDDSFYIERVEFPRIYAVHFVIYGILGRGVSSSSRLDGLGKGFAEFIRDRLVEVPEEIL